MILVDTSIWFAFSVSTHQFHAAAKDFFASLHPNSPALFCRATQQSFLRLLTTERVMGLYGNPPLSNVEAWRLYDSLLTDRRIRFAEEPAALETRWRRYASPETASPKLWMDAYLAAFATAGGHRLVTTDKAFRQFDGLDSIIL